MGAKSSEGPSETRRIDVMVPSGPDQLGAWLYAPPGAPDAEPRPIVVMGHGLGGTKEMGLDPYARRFAADGYRVLVLDYRGFGASTGNPRQVVNRRRQLEDWDAALRFASALPGVDTSRLAIWGSSYGGGLVIDVALRNPSVAAVIAQCPFTDGLVSALAGNPLTALRLALHGFVDVLGDLVGRPPHGVPVCAPEGELGFLTTRDSMQYKALIPEGLRVPGEIGARFALAVMFQRPGRRLRKVTSPTLLCVCDRDLEAPAGTTLRYAASSRAEVKRYPVGHFEIYSGVGFEQAVADQRVFLRRHLAARSTQSVWAGPHLSCRPD